MVKCKSVAFPMIVPLKLIFFVLLVLYSQASLSQEKKDPIRLSVQPFNMLGQTYYAFEFYGAESHVEILSVEVNDGHCKINHNKFPIILKYNQVYRDTFEHCGRVWNVSVTTFTTEVRTVRWDDIKYR